METSALAQVTDLVKAFTPQVDGVRVRKCEIAQKMINLSMGKSSSVTETILPKLKTTHLFSIHPLSNSI